jgi:hypothetical protein
MSMSGAETSSAGRVSADAPVASVRSERSTSTPPRSLMAGPPTRHCRRLSRTHVNGATHGAGGVADTTSSLVPAQPVGDGDTLAAPEGSLVADGDADGDADGETDGDGDGSAAGGDDESVGEGGGADDDGGGGLDGGGLDGGGLDGGGLDGGALDGGWLGGDEGTDGVGVGECVAGVDGDGDGEGEGFGAAATAGTTRVAPKNADHQTGAILTFSPVIGASIIRPCPMYMPTWVIWRQSVLLVVLKKTRSPGSS